jgi:adenine deaminase
MSAREALEIATLGGARVLGLEDMVGSLVPGKRADFIVVEAGGTPEQLAEQAKAAEAEQAAKLVREESERKYREQVSRVIVAASTVKENMHNPASFDLVSAIVMDDDAVCLVYRGTNGFGGIVTSRASAMGRVVSLSAKQWSKYCAGRDGRDFADAVRRAV